MVGGGKQGIGTRESGIGGATIDGADEVVFCWRWTWIGPDAVKLLRCFFARFSDFCLFGGGLFCSRLGCGRQRLADGEEQMILFKEAGKTSHGYSIHTTGGV
jgi:hypothetical protein